jgi:hypothetical protein
MSFYDHDDDDDDDWGFFIEIDAEIHNHHSYVYYYNHEGKKCSKCINLETIYETDLEEEKIEKEKETVEDDYLKYHQYHQYLKRFTNCFAYSCIIITIIYLHII